MSICLTHYTSCDAAVGETRVLPMRAITELISSCGCTLPGLRIARSNPGVMFRGQNKYEQKHVGSFCGGLRTCDIRRRAGQRADGGSERQTAHVLVRGELEYSPRSMGRHGKSQRGGPEDSGQG